MPQDYFAILGLAPGRWSERELKTRYEATRARLLGDLDDPARHAAAREQLDALHLAYATLRDPQRRSAYLRARDAAAEPANVVRDLIAASLEGGLLRYSRRVRILEQARELGLNDFQTQLLIAQVQFGEHDIRPLPRVRVRPLPQAAPARVWAHFAGVGALALAMFLYLLHWLGG